jgi:hypothetical protein
MALRLEYGGIPVGNIEPDVEKAVLEFIERIPKAGSKGKNVIYCTYTAMLKIRQILIMTRRNRGGIGF